VIGGNFPCINTVSLLTKKENLKRIKRNPERFEVLDLYSTIGQKYGFKLNDPKSYEEFVKVINASLENSKTDHQLLYGKRIETLFGYIVGALGNSSFLKSEDSGEIFTDSSNHNIVPPDFKIILKNGSCFFVEVKNYHQAINKAFTLSKKSFEKLSNYSKLHNLPLKIAIYFSQANKWVLLSPESFEVGNKNLKISFTSAYAKSEMSIIGDKLLGTIPDLILEFKTSLDEAAKIEGKDNVPFTIREVNMFCNGSEIKEKTEKDIAFYLMRYGSWVEKKVDNLIVHDKLLGVRFTFSPEFINDEDENEFQLIGTLSEMISNAYKEHTIDDNQIVALSTNADPQIFRPLIPDGYKGKQLPLWQFVIGSNQEFKG